MIVPVRPTDLDSFGHVNNAVYLRYLEWRRWELLEEVGLPPEELARRNIAPVVRSIAIRYRRELRLGDVITVTAEPVGARRELGVLKQDVLKADGTVAAQARVGFLFIDRQSRRPVSLPPEMAAWLMR